MNTEKSQNLILTRDGIIEVIEATEENSAARQRACKHFKNFVDYTGLQFDIDFEKLGGNYSNRTVDQKAKSIIIPSDERLVEVIDELPDDPWKNIYKVGLIYGLRNHEHFFADRTPLKEGKDYILIPEHTKTGFRYCYPNYPEWLDEFELRQAQFPEEIEDFRKQYEQAPQRTSDSVESTELGKIVSGKLKLHKYFPGGRYYFLRYAWVRRSTIDNPMGEEEASNSLGHSVQTHRNIYRRWISVEDFRRSYERFRNNPVRAAAPKRSKRN
ncbi:hypothetical protein H6G00_22340 [Leptolyngbya sp. FACHB-541]|uniref:hypothetical protein n=1 Tax=Leptolyngbya sp. FACHB-541 TaxID=2692810 RepID=UPI00168862C7|nr:hypothetical protein [Leptolyngbya sp. FACHB-541]MBD1999317.1 hypothetical protein [Leptolyngbya sp. FACHB-541]